MCAARSLVACVCSRAGPVILMTEQVDLGRDDFDGEVDDDPFHVKQGVNHYDDSGARPRSVKTAATIRSTASSAAVVIERPRASPMSQPLPASPGPSSAAPKPPKAVSVGAVIPSLRPAASPPSSSDDSSSSGGGNIDLDGGSDDDSDMENPFAQ
jgi:hypothetical protein